jgi:chromosome segregation ATPase
MSIEYYKSKLNQMMNDIETCYAVIHDIQSKVRGYEHFYRNSDIDAPSLRTAMGYLQQGLREIDEAGLNIQAGREKYEQKAAQRLEQEKLRRAGPRPEPLQGKKR